MGHRRRKDKELHGCSLKKDTAMSWHGALHGKPWPLRRVLASLGPFPLPWGLRTCQPKARQTAQARLLTQQHTATTTEEPSLETSTFHGPTSPMSRHPHLAVPKPEQGRPLEKKKKKGGGALCKREWGHDGCDGASLKPSGKARRQK